MVEMAFVVNTAYSIGSIRNYLYISIAESVTLQRTELNRVLFFSKEKSWVVNAD
jgi:hypothetical protein